MIDLMGIKWNLDLTSLFLRLDELVFYAQEVWTFLGNKQKIKAYSI